MITVDGWTFDYKDVGVELTTEFNSSQLSDPFYRYMHRWHAKLFASPPDTGDDLRVPLGEADVLRLRVWDIAQAGASPWEVLDAEEGDLEMVGSVLLDSDGFREEVEELVLDVAPDLLILNHVELLPAARGHELGPLFASLLLEVLVGQPRLIACFPAPIGNSQDELTRNEAIAALGRTWAKVGLRPYQDGVWIIDPAAVDIETKEQLFDQMRLL